MTIDPTHFLDELSRTIDRELEPFGIAETDVPASLVFHYTTAAGLKGILENKYIFATHSMYLNDLSEISFGLSVGTKVLSDELERQRTILMEPIKRMFDDSEIVDKNSAHSALSIGKGKPFDVLWMAYHEFAKWPHKDRYITSFCESGDLLSQWRGYANRGGGYAIGISITRKSIPNDKRTCSAFKVIYDPARQKEILNIILAVTLKRLEHETFPTVRDAEYDALLALYAHVIIIYLRLVGVRFKAPAFSEENEWRFCAETDAGDPEFVKFRVANGSLVPYMELPLLETGIEIMKVVCGPTLNPELSRHSIDLLARKNGFRNLEIELSRIPLSPS